MNAFHALRVAGAALAALALTPADAGFRAYLSATGSDANPCTLPQPCRLLPAALTAVDPGGEIWMLDSANFNVGQVNIAKSVKILAIPGALGSVVATGSGHAINIATAGVKVSLRNLVIVTLGSGLNGINYVDGAQLVVSQCEISVAPPNSGIFASGSGKLAVKDSTIRDSLQGFFLDGSVAAIVDRVRVENAVASGFYLVGSTRLTLNDSVVAGSGAGVTVNALAGNVVRGSISRSTISGNGTGIYGGADGAGSKANITVANSTVSHSLFSALHLMQANSGVTTIALEGNIVNDNAAATYIVGAPAIVSGGTNMLRHNDTGDTLPGTSGWAGQ